ncbi:MAG: hypothetical protein IT372_20485 [Polyangiaceae bacterium]|nr:hypothetical protein [Polyangiaceae bacterium]
MVAGVLGWVMLVGGLSMALLLGLLAVALFPGSIAGWVVGLPIALLAVGVGLPLLLGGRSLEKSGAAAERRTRVEALFSLAANHGGAITARDAGAALDMPADQADALLTELAKERPEDVTVEVSDRGEIIYAFPGVTGQTRSRVRVDERAGVGWRVADAGAGEGEAEGEAAAEESAEGSPARRERAR